MSSDSWSTSAEAERIKKRKQRQEEKRQERAEENPAAFGWEQNDDDQYECMECGKTYRKLPGCLRHINNVHDTEREDGQTGLGEWA